MPRTGGRGRLRISTWASWAYASCLLLLGLQACSTPPDRPAPSTLGCIERVVATRIPAGTPDKRAHCLAGAWIALQCSVVEAQLGAAGKEVRDALGDGDADRRDWDAARAGIACADSGTGDELVEACCERAGW